jgi:hypothetical protein
MSGPFGLEDFGRTIRLKDAVAYLEAHDWRLRREEQHGQIWFESPPDDEGDSIRQYLPLAETYADYPARLEELIKAVSVFEQRPAICIVTEMADTARPGVGTPRAGPAATIEEIIEDELLRIRGTISEAKASELMERLPRGERSIELITDGFGPGGVGHGVALLAVALARMVPASGEWKLFLWRLCARLMQRIDLQLRWVPSQLDEFVELAKSEQADCPDRLREWLLNNATAVTQHQQRKAGRKQRKTRRE